MVYWNIPKGKAEPLFRYWKRFTLSEPEKYGGSLLKNLMHDAPAVFFCLIATGWGFSSLVYTTYREIQTKSHLKHPYKMKVFVVRPDDRLVETTIKQRPTYYEDRMNAPRADAMEWKKLYA